MRKQYDDFTQLKIKDMSKAMSDMTYRYINPNTDEPTKVPPMHYEKILDQVTEKYMASCPLKSILFNASASAVSGQEFPEYAASKAGILGYMRNTAIRLAPQRVTVNAISLGGVLTHLNDPVVKDPDCWKKIMDVTPMKKWLTPDEVADWVLFLTTQNRSMSGENLIIDNGEMRLNATFVWPEGC